MRALLILWLLCHPALGWSQQPPPSPRNSIQQPKRHATKGEKDSHSNQQPTPEPPPLVLVRPALTSQPEAAIDADERRDYTSAEWWLVYVTGALCAITGGLAFYTLRLWRTTKNLVQSAEQTAERQLRAYLTVRLSDFPVPALWTTQTISVHLEIYNAGQTPAYKVAPAIAMRMFPPDLDPRTLFPLDLSTLEGIRKRQMIGPKTALDSIAAMDRPLSESQIKNIREGSLLFYLYGTVFYEDVFKTARTTDFCLKMVVKGESVGALAAEDGNDAT